ETFAVFNGTTPVGNAVTVNVSGGTATASYNLPAGTGAGTYTIKANYIGTSSFSTSSDTSHSVVISPAPTTTIAASVSTNASSSAQSISLSATITSAAGVVNEGTATFTILNGATVISSPVPVNVTAGMASATYNLPPGTVPG